MKRFLICAFAAVVPWAPIAVSAQAPPPGAVPSYAIPAPQDEQIRGRIASFDGAYSLRVNDERGFVDEVRLHQGTIINPTGLTLAPGMVVSILGYNAGSYFSANEIDTPYVFTSGIPYFVGHPWWYYGPTISLAFFFGRTYWWHPGYLGGRYHYIGGVRAYDHASTSTLYSHTGGSFQGRNYVAPPEHGGYSTRSAQGSQHYHSSSHQSHGSHH